MEFAFSCRNSENPSINMQESASERSSNDPLRKWFPLEKPGQSIMFKKGNHFTFICHICSFTSTNPDRIRNHLVAHTISPTGHDELKLSQQSITEAMQEEFQKCHLRDMTVEEEWNQFGKPPRFQKQYFFPSIQTPSVSPDQISMLDSVCQQIVNENQITETQMNQRHAYLKELENYIRLTFSDAQLRMIGSSCDGFGFAQSNLDISLTFGRDPTGQFVNLVSVIEHLTKILCENPNLGNVVPIVKARIPVVKFAFKKGRIQCDLSIYNTISEHSTRLLQTYSRIDERAQILVYTLKYFIQLINADSVPCCGLSSFAYIIMVIYFLQQRQPPVLPVLQDLFDGIQPVVTDGKWDVWFYDDLENLPDVWPHYRTNNESPGELWMALLLFYTEEFNRAEHVISIKQKRVLTKSYKGWYSKGVETFAIEDPFETDRDLGSALNFFMTSYLLETFTRGKNHFSMSIETVPPVALTKDFLFDRQILTNGNAVPCYCHSTVQ